MARASPFTALASDRNSSSSLTLGFVEAREKEHSFTCLWTLKSKQRVTIEIMEMKTILIMTTTTLMLTNTITINMTIMTVLITMVGVVVTAGAEKVAFLPHLQRRQ